MACHYKVLHCHIMYLSHSSCIGQCLLLVPLLGIKLIQSSLVPSGTVSEILLVLPYLMIRFHLEMQTNAHAAQTELLSSGRGCASSSAGGNGQKFQRTGHLSPLVFPNYFSMQHYSFSVLSLIRHILL